MNFASAADVWNGPGLKLGPAIVAQNAQVNPVASSDTSQSLSMTAFYGWGDAASLGARGPHPASAADLAARRRMRILEPVMTGPARQAWQGETEICE